MAKSGARDLAKEAAWRREPARRDAERQGPSFVPAHLTDDPVARRFFMALDPTDERQRNNP